MAAPPPGDLNSDSVATHPIRSQSLRRSRLQSARSAVSPLASKSDQRNRAVQTPATPTIVHSFRPKPHPLWLRLLLKVQQGSSVFTVLLVASMLAVYGWTVYVQQRWGHEYEQLEALKKKERQLTAASELLKNQMAEQAENPTTGLLLPDPSNAIFLTPAPQRSEVKPKPTTSPVPFQNKPLGY
ncbi:MAG: hypothetical protein MUF72_02695 [Elainella sp. Prado103]|nr:hypothetical protein [Elainella sp. Prado103]